MAHGVRVGGQRGTMNDESLDHKDKTSQLQYIHTVLRSKVIFQNEKDHAHFSNFCHLLAFIFSLNLQLFIIFTPGLQSYDTKYLAMACLMARFVHHIT